MNNIIEINFSKVTEEPRYTIIVDPTTNERTNALFSDDGGFWMVYIVCNRFEDIPRMKELALKNLKIKKAING